MKKFVKHYWLGIVLAVGYIVYCIVGLNVFLNSKFSAPMFFFILPAVIAMLLTGKHGVTALVMVIFGSGFYFLFGLLIQRWRQKRWVVFLLVSLYGIISSIFCFAILKNN